MDQWTALWECGELASCGACPCVICGVVPSPGVGGSISEDVLQAEHQLAHGLPGGLRNSQHHHSPGMMPVFEVTVAHIFDVYTGHKRWKLLTCSAVGWMSQEHATDCIEYAIEIADDRTARGFKWSAEHRAYNCTQS